MEKSKQAELSFKSANATHLLWSANIELGSAHTEL